MKKNIILKIDNDNIRLDIILAEKCWDCDGGTKEPVFCEEDSHICQCCGGSGYEVTKAGKAILDLIEISKSRIKKEKTNDW